MERPYNIVVLDQSGNVINAKIRIRVGAAVSRHLAEDKGFGSNATKLRDAF